MSANGESSKGKGVDRPPATGAIHKELKIQLPDTFHRERSKLKHFLMQVDLYIGFNMARFASDTEKVLWIATLLRGPALQWIQGYVEDYLHNNNEGRVTTAMSKDTIMIFQTMTGFRQRIEQVFGDVDERRQAERSI
jgi:hypothetical protein